MRVTGEFGAGAARVFVQNAHADEFGQSEPERSQRLDRMRAQSRYQSAHQKAQRLVLEFAHPHHADMEVQAKCRIGRRAGRWVSLASERRRPDSEISISSSLTCIACAGIKDLDIQVGGRQVGWSP